jgi:hypothetical protein
MVYNWQDMVYNWWYYASVPVTMYVIWFHKTAGLNPLMRMNPYWEAMELSLAGEIRPWPRGYPEWEDFKAE